MTNIVQSLKIRCKHVGISLHEVCRLANVPRETLAKWEKEEPKTVKQIRKLGVYFGIENPLQVLPHLKEWSQKNSIHNLSLQVQVDYRNIQRWIKWKGIPKSIALLQKVEDTIKQRENEAQSNPK